jgi:hypothetical protein
VQDDTSEAFGCSFYGASVIFEAISPGKNILHVEEASRMWGRWFGWSDIQGIGLWIMIDLDAKPEVEGKCTPATPRCFPYNPSSLLFLTWFFRCSPS